VMPAGFAFPQSHAWWVPLRLGAADYAPGEGPALEMFGRLAPGATLEAAQAELAVRGRRAAADFPVERGHVRPEVIPLGESLFSVRMGATLRAALHAANVPLVLFLVLVCGNVAMLTFARAATREGEIVVRTALGASRRRVVMQLFAEALVLGALAAAVDPALRLDTVLPMDEIQAGDLRMEGYVFRLLVIVSVLALALSLAGVYAVTSFTVARRTREIGIRVALGADPRRVAATIVRRPLAQVAVGVLLGCTLLALWQQAASTDGLSLRVALLFVAYGTALFAICLLACVVPTRRALRVEPTTALRAEG